MTEPIYQYQLIDPDGEATDWRDMSESRYWAFIREPQPDVRVRRAWVLDAEPLATNDELVALLPDPPDGGAPSVLEQLQRMAADAARWRKAQNILSKEVPYHTAIRDVTTRSGDHSTRQYATAVLVGLNLIAKGVTNG